MNKLMSKRNILHSAMFFAAACLPHLVAAVPVYTAIALGDIYGGVGINDHGQVVAGNSEPGESTRAFLYSGGALMDLGSLGGGDSSAWGINNSGQVVGSSRTSSGDYHAFLYSGGVMSDLGSLGGESGGSGINNSGQVVGSYDYPGGYILGPDGRYHYIYSASRAFIYSGGIMSDLGDLPGSLKPYTRNSNSAYGINDSGQVTGSAESLIGTRAFLYSSGVMSDLGTLGGYESYGRGINNVGQVVGSSLTTSHDYHAFLYSGGVMSDLGTLGGDYSFGMAINDSGQVVGRSDTASDGYHAFLYSGGVMSDLNKLLAPGLGITLQDAMGINNYGQIVANDDQDRAYLLSPLVPVTTLAKLSSDAYNGGGGALGFSPMPITSSPNYDPSHTYQGFQAFAYKNGDDIVVAIRGTDLATLTSGAKNLIADASFGNSSPTPELRDYVTQAAQFVSNIQARNPGARITLTGH